LPLFSQPQEELPQVAEPEDSPPISWEIPREAERPWLESGEGREPHVWGQRISLIVALGGFSMAALEWNQSLQGLPDGFDSPQVQRSLVLSFSGVLIAALGRWMYQYFAPITAEE